MSSKRRLILIITSLVCFLMLIVAIFLTTYLSSIDKNTFSQDLVASESDVQSFGSDDLDCGYFNTFDVRNFISEELSSRSEPYPFGNDEYECTGSCYCDESVKRRRNAMKLSSGLKIVVTAISTFAAFQFANLQFSEECEEQFLDDCSSETSILSSVDECSIISKSEDGRLLLLSDENKNLITNAFVIAFEQLNLHDYCVEVKSTIIYDPQQNLLESITQKMQDSEDTLFQNVNSQFFEETQKDDTLMKFGPIIRLIAQQLIQNVFQKILDKATTKRPKNQREENNRIIASGKCVKPESLAVDVFCDDVCPDELKTHLQENILPFGSYDYVSKYDMGFKKFYDGVKIVLRNLCMQNGGSQLVEESIYILLRKMPRQYVNCGLYKNV